MTSARTKLEATLQAITGGILLLCACPLTVSAQTNQYAFRSAPFCPSGEAVGLSNTVDPYGFHYREDTSFVAWRMNSDLGATQKNRPSFTDAMNGGHWGSADHWSQNAIALGYPVDATPQVGTIAHWAANECANCTAGHVAYVEAVNDDGSVNVSEYNFSVAHGFDTRTGIRPPRFIHINTSTMGYLDLAGDAGGINPVGIGGTLHVEGWAANTADGTPVSNVLVMIDGVSVGTATLGTSRPDVAAYYGKSAYTTSGWKFEMPASSLSTGDHTVNAMAIGSSGRGFLFNSKPIAIVTAGGGRAIGFVDSAGDATENHAIAKGGTLYVAGWAADTVGGAPLVDVTVLIDGISVGKAMQGGSRPDIVKSLGNNVYATSGWNFQMSTASLSVGTHTVTATATGPSGSSLLGRRETITIAAADGGREIGHLDAAGDAAANPTIAKDSMLHLSGWAADTVSGPVSRVMVLIDGISVGTAITGDSRPDVAGDLGKNIYAASGWHFQISTSALSVGTHTVTATAIGPSGSGSMDNGRTITIAQ